MGLGAKILDICGFKMWPPASDDPAMKGPQPRIISKRQWEALQKVQQTDSDTDTCCVNK